MLSADSSLFPPIEPFDRGHLAVDDLHTLYWEQCGNPRGVPVVFLHGGPGNGCDGNSPRHLDPAHYRIVLFDQRGAKRSTPLGETRQNAPDLLVSDIEALRRRVGVDRWHVFGGSWGSALALLYAQRHPERCRGLVLRGISLFDDEGLDWWFDGMRVFFPER